MSAYIKSEPNELHIWEMSSSDEDLKIFHNGDGNQIKVRIVFIFSFIVKF